MFQTRHEGWLGSALQGSFRVSAVIKHKFHLRITPKTLNLPQSRDATVQ